MQNRYHLDNKEYMIEFPHDETGLEDAKRYRMSNPEFRFRHIKEVIQAYPEQIPFHVLIRMK